MADQILIGCNGRGAQASSIQHPVSNQEAPIDEQMRLVKETGAFDFFDRLPMAENFEDYERAKIKYDLPVMTASWYYQLGADEHLLAPNIRRAHAIGARMHNVMVYTRHADGHVVTDQDVIDFYMRCYDEGMKVGVEPSFELHVNMWSEDYRRVSPVARAVQSRGIPFNFTLDYSHVIFKIGNPEEQDISGVREDVEAGRLVLDPFEDGNLCDEWLSMGIVRWLQVRCVAPNGPRNIWSRIDPSVSLAALPPGRAGEFGRGILYPFTRPAPGEWHSPWFAYNLEPTKEVVRKVLRYHQQDPKKRLSFITTEMINLPDYGDNAKFSLIGQNAAIARFVRKTWIDLNRADPNPSPAS
jgi:hypothetical protein